MKVLFVTSEALPFIKTGGLGDVSGALPAALSRLGLDVRVVLPLYSNIAESMRKKLRFVTSFYIHNSWRKQYCGVFEADIDGVKYYLIDNEYYYKRPSIYGDYDDGERFAYFCRAVMELMGQVDFIPDILHLNDWQTAFCSVLLRAQYAMRPGYALIKSVYTIHNIEFQGKYDPYILGDVFGLGEYDKPLLYYGDCINLSKGAIECSHAVTTVSPTYAAEIQDPYYAFGLEDILRARSFKIHGILNGIDTELYNPETDPKIKVKYSFKTCGLKRHNRAALLQKAGLGDSGMPVIGMVSRLTHQKGLDLLIERMDWMMGLGFRLIVLGTGDKEYTDALESAAWRHGGMCFWNRFDDGLARMIYAGCDFFLMPSKYEPCGLSQMIALRYGTPPIARLCGGLRDTVFGFDSQSGTGNGITFFGFDGDDFASAIWRAGELFDDKAAYSLCRKNAMSGDYSWDKSAKQYRDLYFSLMAMPIL